MDQIDKCRVRNEVDRDGNPAGGRVQGVGLEIEWQDGPLGRGDDRREPNGAFVETVVHAAMERIRFYQSAKNGKFYCEENAKAYIRLAEALGALQQRTQRREDEGTEGTHVEKGTPWAATSSSSPA